MSESEIPPDPWAWRIPMKAWYALQASQLSKWKPAPTLEASASVPRVLAEAALREAEWLYHPLLSAVTLNESRDARDLRLILWAAAHDRSDSEFGSLVVKQPVWMWDADGGGRIEPGSFDIRELAGRFRNSQGSEKRPIAIDPWIDVLGLPLPEGIVDYQRWSWAHSEQLSADEETQLKREVVGFFVSVNSLTEKLPACAAWISAITKIVVPLRGTPETRFRSGSSAAIPGLVFTDIDGPVEQVIESLVHESAHHWFCVAETTSPLVDPLAQTTYKSPLRSDPRPLRGIFLAFHALAFMAAFYSDWTRIHSDLKRGKKLLDSVRTLRDDAYGTLEAARGELTDYGRDFLDRTVGVVVAYAD